MVNRAFQSYAFFLGLAFIMLLLLSPDSFLYDIYGKCDSSCFYVDGKAWMNGLTPYVDFYDVKGPLLFLFYGIGYLISPHNYLGVFYISVFWYAWILFFTQKMAKVFLISYWKAWTASALMLLVYLNPLIHWEFRAEDICTLFVVISLYEMCNLLYGKPIDCKRQVDRTALIVGICFSGCLMVKFSLAFMMFIFVLYLLLFSHSQHIGIFRPFTIFLGGGTSAYFSVCNFVSI